MIKCTFTPKSFELNVSDRALSILEAGLSDVETRNELYKILKDVSESMGLSGPAVIQEAVKIAKDILSFFPVEQHLDDNDIMAAVSEWKHITEPEDTTTDHLNKDNEKVERINDDPFESNYSSATNAKMRAKLLANNIGVKSILYNENGIINSTTELNESIRELQEQLLLKIIQYLKTRVSPENQLKHPEVFNGRMYIGENYTGIIETILELYNSILGGENFNTKMLNRYYNDKNFNTLDAYNSWIILNNFDTILSKIFGKAIKINPDMLKFSGKNKYSIAGGSNVYTTWRTSDEIDMSKEINNISLAIITTIPFITKGSTTSTDSYIKFNEFLYIISKIKDIPYKAKNDWIILFNPRSKVSKTLRDLTTGKSFLSLINQIRSNPLENLPILLELLNSSEIINSLVSNNVLEGTYFLDIDLNLINSIYRGLFDLSNENSLNYILNKTGFDKNNYFAFISLTIDSTFKSSFLQYFRDPQGNIYVRPMYDLSISNIEASIRQLINSINSKLLTLDYGLILDKYHITETTRMTNTDSITELHTEVPESISFIIDNYHKGPLKVTVNLFKNEILYEVNGELFKGFTSKKDYDSLEETIQDILKQNLNIDNSYFDAYKNIYGEGSIGIVTTNLMTLVARVISNLYISNKYLDKLSPRLIREKLETIFQDKSIKPTYNRKLKEINLLTDADTKTLNELALAKAQATGKLTSSQILDSNGNAMAASSLSRLLSSLNYQIELLVKINGAAAQGFSLWNTGVFKGIQQMKEVLDNLEDSSKSHTKLSNAEMIYSTVFIDFLQSLTAPKSIKTPLQNGITAFIPSENSDKTYIGRMLVDISKIKIGEENLFDILRKDPTRIQEFIPTIRKELGEFYTKAKLNIDNDWTRVGLAITSKTGLVINISYGNWEALRPLALLEGKTVLLYVNDIVTEYNNLNPTNPITLTDLVHYVPGKNGELLTNTSLLENVRRFSEGNSMELDYFLHNLNIESVKEILKSKLEVPTTPEIKLLLGKEWIDERTNTVIFAKVWDDYDVDSEPELLLNVRKNKDLELLEKAPQDMIQINPLLESYNILNYFFTQEFMGSTVGMFYAHPNKKYTLNPIEDEKARKLALDKRNVSFTAAMHAFLKNLIQGVPEEINIAIMSDPKDYFLTISGDLFDIKPFDGATFSNPFYGEMENASLCGAKVGINKKTFTHYYDSRTGTGGIIKTAEFPLTNDRIRNSKFYLRMMINMTDRIWRNENGSPFIIELDGYKDWDETRTKSVFYVLSNDLLDYNGNAIEFTNPNDNQGNLYFKIFGEDGKPHYYKINSIEYLGNNLFKREIQEVDKHGMIISDNVIPETFEVNSNYKLWNLFGGAYVMEQVPGSRELTFTENSIKLTAKIINLIGTKKNEIVRTLKDIYQPMKHSDIHLMPTIGAVKLGAANINEVDKYNVADSNQINFMRIKLDLAGILLDKEHNADDEDLSIMTLVISACAARGYTQEQSQAMYDALGSLARAGIKEYIDKFNEFFKSPSGLTADAFLKVILDTLVDALIHSTNSSSTLNIVTLELLNKAKEGKEIAFKDLNIIPYSDPAVFRKLHSTIAVALTRGAIKIKVNGILSVLCPSYGIHKIFNNKTLSRFNDDSEILTELEAFNSDPNNELVNNIGKLKLGRTYKIKYESGLEELRTIKTLEEYYKLKRELSYRKMDTPEVVENKINQASWEEKLNVALRLGLEVVQDTTPQTVEEFVSLNFPSLTPESIKQELGWEQKDLKRMFSIQRTKENGGLSVQRAAESLIGQMPTELAELTDSNEVRNIILDLLSSSETPNDITKRTIQNRIYDALNLYNNLYLDSLDHIITSVIELFAPEGNFEGGRELGSYNATFREKVDLSLGALASNIEGRLFNINDLASIKELSELKSLRKNIEDNKELTSEEKTIQLTQIDLKIEDSMKSVLADLMKLHNKNGIIKLDNGEEVEIDSNSVEIEPYEIIMPKIFATIFGLNIDDDLNEIKLNKEFFVNRLLENIQSKMPKEYYTLGLMRVSGNHTYILDKNQNVHNSPYFTKKDIFTYEEKGKIWRVNSKGEKLYQITKGDTVWEYRNPNGDVQEVIVTSNIGHYIKNSSYTTLNVSNNANKENILEILKKNRKKAAVKSYLNAVLDIMNTYGDNLSDAMNNIQNVTYEDIKDSPVGNYFLHLGHLLHTSFLKSLLVVAARIPAQSMQSFMPMKVIAFEAPDINTAYVSTAQFLFQGSDLDIDAVSLASYSFDHSGRYVLHCPFANVETIENLEACEDIPFPTGILINTISSEEGALYSNYIGSDSDPTVPFIVGSDAEGNLVVRVDLSNPAKIDKFSNFIKIVNRLKGLPRPITVGNNGKILNDNSINKEVLSRIVELVNEHNDFINDESAEDFSKNYVVSTMYKIGLSPANLIESQQAMDSITGPIKKIANNTIKAKITSQDNPGSFITNIHGITLNMAGKEGVGICAVGLKSFFALTARYNEVLKNGNEFEQERLKSEVIIAGKKFQMLANAYGTNIVNKGIAEVINSLSNQDLALLLSGLLSLATDNAKELALDKLNASNFLGMYIYGITIGVDFLTLANIICSRTGLVINEMMEDNIFTGKKKMSIQNIFDYLETAPDINAGVELSNLGLNIMNLISKENLYLTAWIQDKPLNECLNDIDKLKKQVDKDIEKLNKNGEISEEYVALHKALEKAEEYYERIDTIKLEYQIYEDFKKLNEGGEELRRLGQLLHINLGLYTQCMESIKYLDTVTSVVKDRMYSKYREEKRVLMKEVLKGNPSAEKALRDLKAPKDNWIFDFHRFVSEQDYREAWIDIYGGTINMNKFENNETYRELFLQVYPSNSKTFNSVKKQLKTPKVFFNILDALSVSHYNAYLQSADVLHLAMMKTSAKYRAIYELGRKAVNSLGAYSQDDKEAIYRRTELFVDRTIRDRFLLDKGIKINIPRGLSYFTDSLEKETSKGNSTILLGTRAGNASFKMLMETKIIPDLLLGKLGSNIKEPAISENEFIKSLNLSLFTLNPEFTITINYSPNINMSPRSDADKALFEKIKYAFNAFRYAPLSSFKYTLGGEKYDLLELFYYYNQIAFGGRPGENTLTNIFLDVLDYRVIKEFRDYENAFDMEGKLEIDTYSLAREVAPRANPWTTNLEGFYYEDSASGELSYWTKISNNEREEAALNNVYLREIRGYGPVMIGFSANKDLKNYITTSNNRDTNTTEFLLANENRVLAKFILGKIDSIKIIPKDNPSGSYNLSLSKESKEAFNNLKPKWQITPNGRKLDYDIQELRNYIELIQTCSV